MAHASASAHSANHPPRVIASTTLAMVRARMLPAGLPGTQASPVSADQQRPTRTGVRLGAAEHTPRLRADHPVRRQAMVSLKRPNSLLGDRAEVAICGDLEPGIYQL